MSLEETMQGKYYEITSSEEYIEAENNFIAYCEEKRFSDDIEVQFIDGCLSGRATDYIKEMLELAEQHEEELEIVSEIFNSVCNIEEAGRCLEDRNYSIYPLQVDNRYQDKEDAFISYLEDIDFFCGIPENIISYLDYKKIMRDFEIEGMEIIEYLKGYIIINHY